MNSSKPTTSLWNFLRSLSRLVLLLALAALSCSLPSKAVNTPTQSAIPAVTSEPSVEPTPGKTMPPRSLTQIVSDKVNDGTWTEEESLLIGLRFLAGEIPHADVFGDTVPMSTEGTGIIRAAQRYLVEGQDAQAKEEIQRYINMLLPSPEILEQISRPATQSSIGPQLVSLSTRPKTDEVECQELWRDSFSSPGPITCLLRVERTVRGTDIRLYYPEYWGADDPRLAQVELIMNAAEESVAMYNGFGPEAIHPIYMVLTDLAYYDTRSSAFQSDVFAAADDYVTPSTCHVGIFPYSLESAQDVLEQTIAHEIFHCYQFRDLRPQTLDLPESINDWWVEGTAEFFGASVYPANNAEFIYNNDFQNNSTYSLLFDMSYENYLFFQYLAREGGLGLEGVVELLRQMPKDGGFEKQQDALAAVDGMDEKFHAFVRAYVDHRLTDMSGTLVSIDPSMDDIRNFGEGVQAELFDPASFFLGIYHVNFADQTRFENLLQEDGDPGAYAMRPAEFVGAWQPVPSAINTVCDPTEYILIVTSTLPATAQAFQVTLQASGAHQESDVCDECLKGTWELVNDSDFYYLSTLTNRLVSNQLTAEVSMHLAAVTGQVLINFGEDGQASGTQRDFTWLYEVIAPDGTHYMADVFNGGGAANYEIREMENREKFIFFQNSEFDLAYQLKADDVIIQSLHSTESNGPFFLSSIPARYVCQENSLLYTTMPDLGTLRFVRIP